MDSDIACSRRTVDFTVAACCDVSELAASSALLVGMAGPLYPARRRALMCPPGLKPGRVLVGGTAGLKSRPNKA
jgi:hypothetical protein